MNKNQQETDLASNLFDIGNRDRCHSSFRGSDPSISITTNVNDGQDSKRSNDDEYISVVDCGSIIGDEIDWVWKNHTCKCLCDRCCAVFMFIISCGCCCCGCKIWSFIYGKWKKYYRNMIAKHHSLYVLIFTLLYRIVINRMLVIWDVVSDLLIVAQLYLNNDIFWFGLSSILIVTPFLVTWNVSLRLIKNELIDKYKDKYSKSKENNSPKYKYLILSHLLTGIFLFPITGAIVLFIYEITSSIYDFLHCIFHLIFYKWTKTDPFEIAFKNKFSTRNIFKQYRKTVELLGESIPQTLLQCYIYYRIKTSENSTFKIDQTTLIMSLATSTLTFIINLFRLYNESKHHGTYFVDYIFHILQMSRIPLSPFVPQIGNVEYGLKNLINLSHFQLNDESYNQLANALSSTESQIKTIILSMHSISHSHLNFHVVENFAALLKKKRINLIVSGTLDTKHIVKRVESIFQNKNYIEAHEFTSDKVVSDMYPSLSGRILTEKQKMNIFQSLAIRNDEKIYKFDYFNSILNLDEKNGPYQNQLKFLKISNPLAFILDYILNLHGLKNTQTVIHALNNFLHLSLAYVCSYVTPFILASLVATLFCTFTTTNNRKNNIHTVSCKN